MSLITKLVVRNHLSTNLFRHPIQSKVVISRMEKSTGSAQQQMDDFWKKNKDSNRPMSPHLTIYKPELTSMLSLTHRATGIVLAVATTGFAASSLFFPENADVMLMNLQHLHSTFLGTSCIISMKCTLLFPLVYHCCNGLRHLLWDTANVLTLSQVYSTGWAVLFTSMMLAVAIAVITTKKD